MREQRFDELYAVRPGLVAYITRLGIDAAAAEDVAHEAFVVVWRHLDRVPDGEDGIRWMFGVARKLSANVRRGIRRRIAFEDRVRRLRAPHPSPVEDTRLAAAAAWSELSADERRVLATAASAGSKPTGLAAAVGCSPVAATMRLSRARARLRAALNEPVT